MDVVLGFDPGGVSQFGWAILECSKVLPLRVRASGVANNAQQAVGATLAELHARDHVMAAGIDSPLYWTPTGERESDRRIRDIIRRAGARSAAGGTIQHPNCLQGACVVQGPIAALLLRSRMLGLPLTESHPKALLWALGLASESRRPKTIFLSDLSHLAGGSSGGTEHERDAVLGGFAAWSMVVRAEGWTDFISMEREPLFFTTEPVAYWFPSVPSMAA
jgi:hypothetical protein